MLTEFLYSKEPPDLDACQASAAPRRQRCSAAGSSQSCLGISFEEWESVPRGRWHALALLTELLCNFTTFTSHSHNWANSTAATSASIHDWSQGITGVTEDVVRAVLAWSFWNFAIIIIYGMASSLNFVAVLLNNPFVCRFGSCAHGLWQWWPHGHNSLTQCVTLLVAVFFWTWGRKKRRRRYSPDFRESTSRPGPRIALMLRIARAWRLAVCCNPNACFGGSAGLLQILMPASLWLCAGHALFIEHAHVWHNNCKHILSKSSYGSISQLVASRFQPIRRKRDSIWGCMRLVIPPTWYMFTSALSRAYWAIAWSVPQSRLQWFRAFFFRRMKDRNFDMPYIMLRGQNFFVTYGWSLNNICLVSVLKWWF